MLTSVAWGAQDILLEESQALTTAFASRLSDALESALASGGPALAVGVCKDLAPQIASELSRNSGAKVGRTSLRYRNPVNAPEPWQRNVLETFANKMTSSANSEPLEYFDRGNKDTPARYARAIPTGGVCLACHGSDVPDDVLQILDAEYPFDLARGYELGQLRGAFSVTWPIVQESQ